jgi:putative flippase GtrA
LSPVVIDRHDAFDRLVEAVPGRLGRLLKTEQGRYLAIGGTMAVGYLALVAAGLGAGLPYMLAITVAQIILIACAFPAYRTWVFRSQGALLGDLLRFLSVWSGGLAASFLGTPFLVEVLGMPPLPAQILTVVVVALGSYLGHKFFSFRHGGTRAVSVPRDPS